MHPAIIQKILAMPIAALGFTPDFKLRTEEMGFATLAQIISAPCPALTGKSQYTEAWMEELVEFASQTGFSLDLKDMAQELMPL